jgi:hydrogenase maturation protease
MFDPPAPILVLGIGNELLKDDGVGIALLNAVREQWGEDDRIEFLDGGTQGIALLGRLDGRKTILILDAVSNGSPPGTIHQLPLDDVLRLSESQTKSAHEFGAAELLAATQLIGELTPDTTIIGIEPEELKTEIDLSEVVSEAMPEACSRIAAVLNRAIDQIR